MSISANSYGSVAEVMALTKRYTAAGSYTSTTRPTLNEVEEFIDRVSALLNVCLAKNWFSVPVTAEIPKLALDHFVVAQAAELCHYANGQGALIPGRNDIRPATPFEIIQHACEKFIDKEANGLENLGAVKTRANTYGLGYRGTDDSGGNIDPPFQMKQFGNQNIDWDVAE